MKFSASTEQRLKKLIEQCSGQQQDDDRIKDFLGQIADVDERGRLVVCADALEMAYQELAEALDGRLEEAAARATLAGGPRVNSICGSCETS